MAILDNDGNRILAKYYDKNVFPSSKEQKAFEKNLFSKTHRANAEIIMLDGLTCVYRSNVDLYFYVMGSSHENEVCKILIALKMSYVWHILTYVFVTVNFNECTELLVWLCQSNSSKKRWKESSIWELGYSNVSNGWNLRWRVSKVLFGKCFVFTGNATIFLV